MNDNTESKKSGFFAVSDQVLTKAAGAGMNAAVAYLVLACGTGHDNVTTGWSADAVHRYGGISWRRAKAAIDDLARKKVIVSRKGATKPKYKLQRPKALIWMPNTFVTGADDETPPLKRIRQSRDLEALTLCVRLYGVHELAEDDGLPRTVMRWPYDRTRLFSRGQYEIYGFDRSRTRYHGNIGPLNPYAKSGDGWDHLTILEDTQVIEWIPCLAESDEPDAELIHPLAGDERADAVQDAIHEFMDSCAEDIPRIHDYDYAIPIPRHMTSATVVAIARFRYRPQTSMTASWWQDYAETCQTYAAIYERVSQGDMRFVA